VTGRKPPVFETARVALGDASRSIEAMPAMAGIACVLMIATSLARQAIVPSSPMPFGSPWGYVIAISHGTVNAVLLAPMAIAVHRFVLLGETTNRYPLEPRSSRYLRFVGFALLVQILPLIPVYIMTLLVLDDQHDWTLATGLSILGFVLIIAIVLRRVILFPAIAIDAPGATWRNAALDIKGSSWRLAVIFVLVALPLMLMSFVFNIFALLPMPLVPPNTSKALLSSVIGAVIGVAALCAFAAAASRIYQARADFMTRPGI
jgi:hypothetical protein